MTTTHSSGRTIGTIHFGTFISLSTATKSTAV
jgi:hypothetical protein